MPQFIGSKEIKKTEKEEKTIKVFFSDEEFVILNNNLFDLIVRDKSNKGDVDDTINYILSLKFLLDMSDYGLNVMQSANVSRSIETLSNNNMQSAIAKKFDVDSHFDIKLEQIFNTISYEPHRDINTK